mgnify:CR=1 FL=1
MRLGVVGMVPSNFREITPQHLEAISALELTGAGFHYPGDKMSDLKTEELHAVRQTFKDAQMDLVQFGIGYGECLFDPEGSVRESVLNKIYRGIEVARELDSIACLIRTGSLNPQGPYAPSKFNQTIAAKSRLIETLGLIARKAEQEDVNVVIETHLLTIMGSPETNKEIINEIGSKNISVVMDYVNHFQNLEQVYNNKDRLNQIFSSMNPITILGHCKDINIGAGLVLHIDEAIPGEGELDIGFALKLWHEAHPDGYMLLEHLPNEHYPRAAKNTIRIIRDQSIPLC